MNIFTVLFLIVTAFLTALLSGIFGMAGGLVLMGALALVLPVSAAFVTHGILQLVANGWRAVLHRQHINRAVLSWFALATVSAGLIVYLLAFVPPKPLVFLLMGLLPILIWLPKTWFAADASRPAHALASGFAAAVLNLTAGVSGPLIDTVFVRTGLTRHEIVATKAAIQSLNHISKIAVYGLMLDAAATEAMPSASLFALAIPMSILGTTAGGWVLDRLTDANFRRWTAWIVSAIGLFYLWKAWDLWF